MPSVVQILKESKARFEGVIFNQTADLGTNKSTSCKVIDEATGEVIAQSGGGGGESDFTIAEVTIDTLDGLSTRGVIGVFEYDGQEYFDIDTAHGSFAYNAVLYKGLQDVYVEDSIGSHITGMEKTGDIEITEENGVYRIRIKGDGTVTITTAAPD